MKTTKRKTKSKPQPFSGTQCDGVSDNLKVRETRRSIPVAEVHKMLDEQAKSLTKEPTLWDRRVELIARIHSLEEEVEFHDNRALSIRATLGEAQRELQSVVKAIGSELSLDHLH